MNKKSNNNNNINTNDMLQKLWENRRSIMAKLWQHRKLLLVVAAMLAAVWAWQQLHSTSSEIAITKSTDIDITPEQIQSITDIGQWEFLAVSNEELVDTTRRGLLSDDHLSRIYYGTLRLGVDLRDAKEGWLSAKGDTVSVLMPKIRLLDEDFIDEARTKSFFESGRWTAADREAMYRKAKRQMIGHSLTQQNVSTAQTIGEAQMQKLLQALGFSHVVVDFEE